MVLLNLCIAADKPRNSFKAFDHVPEYLNIVDRDLKNESYGRPGDGCMDGISLNCNVSNGFEIVDVICNPLDLVP